VISKSLTDLSNISAIKTCVLIEKYNGIETYASCKINIDPYFGVGIYLSSFVFSKNLFFQ
jgi:hypothetical protein